MSRSFERTQARRLRAFGSVVREARLRRGLSQERLGLRCGLDRTYVSGIERGVRNPTLTVVHRLAQGLGTTASTLLADADKS